MNELILYEKLSDEIAKPRKETVFPLTPTHRKELRRLRDDNISDLKIKVAFIKSEKKKDFLNLYKNKVEKELESQKVNCELLNGNWEGLVKEVNRLIEKRKDLEKELTPQFAKMNCDYGDVARLELIKSKRELTLDISTTTNTISNNIFDEKYGVVFEEVNKKIDLLNTSYEEAINFGDLEIVKRLYYMFKDAEQFLEKLRKIKITVKK